MIEPKHFMIGFCGFSGVGKDECAGHLVRNYEAIHTGLADPAKRHLADLYGFTRTQLFGPTYTRNAGDPRHPKPLYYRYKCRYFGSGEELSQKPWLKGSIRKEKNYHTFKTESLIQESYAVRGNSGWDDLPYLKLRDGFRYFVEEDHPSFFLSPREALQKYCELMNDLYLNTWVEKGIEIHEQLSTILENKPHEGRMRLKYEYDRMLGVRESSPKPLYHDIIITCFSDIRHKHEIKSIRDKSGRYIPVIVRVKNPLITSPPFNHRSEIEQSTIPDSEFDFIINNDGTLDDLYKSVDHILEIISNPTWERIPHHSLSNEEGTPVEKLEEEIHQ